MPRPARRARGRPPRPPLMRSPPMPAGSDANYSSHTPQAQGSTARAAIDQRSRAAKTRQARLGSKMTPSIRLGRLLGIEIGFNWSLIFIAALIAWTLAVDVLPGTAPGYDPATYS